MATTTPDAGVRGGLAEQGEATTQGGAPMTHRQIMEALSGLLLGMFVAILSSTIVSNALPQIITDLGGGQSAYTWVVTAALLSMTATTPLWGKLADLFSKKLLVQTALVIYVAGSVVAGLSQNTGMLIACRVVQGIGVGGLTALSQIILAAMISPRERGRYSGYLGATFAVATVGGPLLGGVITDTDWLGWRWCFYVGVPFAIIALLVLQKTLKLPVVKRQVKVDWAGAVLISAAVSLLLVWVTFAGDKYDWMSWQTAAMVGGSIVLGGLFTLVEARASEPIIPLRLFRNRTITLASLASLFVGVAMFAGTVFFSQYFQLARNESPTMSGVLTIPMIAGLFVSSTVSGMVITKTGRWKAWLVSGGVLVTGGLGLLGTIRYDTEYWHIAVFMAVMGLGLGMMMQNLVLCTQNQVAPADLGSASSMVTFFRSLGGAVGVSALGAVLANRVTHYAQDGMAALGPKAAGAGQGGTGGGIPDMDKLPAPIRTVMESAYGHGVADVFLYSAPFALLAFLVTLFIKEVALQSASTGPAAPKTASGEPAAPAAPAPESSPEPEVTATGLTISGTIRTADGTGVSGATVTLISLGGRQLGRAVVRGEGGYAFDAPGAGSYVLIASADGYQPQASTVVVHDGPLTHDVLLTGTSGLAGSVTAAESGAPVDGAMVVITDVRGEVLATGKTGADGGFSFAELVPGAVTVAVTASGYRPQAMPVEIGGQGVTRLDVALAAGAVVQGTVRAGRDHRPLADARVTLVDAAGNVAASATTDTDGAYAFADLDAGEYTLIATGYPPVAGRLSVTGAGVDGHDIELAHPGE
ncbi:DHA2 family efflux MFS transporter permease subunit [Streptomyces sp. NPDC093600]|uniref:MFS transporter n=1 Tax=Streptomyces sp. NPDC093600 TaxID=3366047 RepID=UPI0037F1D52F